MIRSFESNGAGKEFIFRKQSICFSFFWYLNSNFFQFAFKCSPAKGTLVKRWKAIKYFFFLFFSENFFIIFIFWWVFFIAWERNFLWCFKKISSMQWEDGNPWWATDGWRGWVKLKNHKIIKKKKKNFEISIRRWCLTGG